MLVLPVKCRYTVERNESNFTPARAVSFQVEQVRWEVLHCRDCCRKRLWLHDVHVLQSRNNAGVELWLKYRWLRRHVDFIGGRV